MKINHVFEPLVPFVPTDERPLVTFAVLAFNQELFVADAVSGALAQTYVPLEVILSDDCSQDRTFDIMLKMAQEYRGPHRIIVQRQNFNLGIGRHVNDVVETSSGLWIVGAAGDDVSLPRRTERLMAEWERMGRRPRSLFSNAIIIAQDGKEIGRIESRPPAGKDLAFMCRHNMPGMVGCAHAFHRENFSKFGPLLTDLTIEDRAIALRSLILGGWAVVEEPLVYYRQNENSVTASWLVRESPDDIRKSIAQRARMKLSVYRQWRRDLEMARINDAAVTIEISRLEEIWRFNAAMQGEHFILRLAGFVRAMVRGVPKKYAMKWYLSAASYLVYRHRLASVRTAPCWDGPRIAESVRYVMNQKSV